MRVGAKAVRQEIERAIIDAETESETLKQGLKKAAARLSREKLPTPVPPREIGDSVNLQIFGDDHSSVRKSVKSVIAFAKLVEIVQSVIADARYIGYQEPLDRTVTWIRNSTDIILLFKRYFTRQMKTFDVVPISEDSIAAVKKLDLKQVLNFSESTIAFKAQFPRSEKALLLLCFDASCEFADAQEYCRTIYPRFDRQILVLVDDAGDQVDIDSEEAWVYAAATARRMGEQGLIPQLIFGSK
jgi:hypothetical protein